MKRNFCSVLVLVVIIFATIRSDVYLIDYFIYIFGCYALLFHFIYDYMTWQAVRESSVRAIFDRIHFIFQWFSFFSLSLSYFLKITKRQSSYFFYPVTKFNFTSSFTHNFQQWWLLHIQWFEHSIQKNVKLA